MTTDTYGDEGGIEAFFAHGWIPEQVLRAEPRAGLANCAAHRETLSRRLPGVTLVVPCGVESIRANDTTYPFRASSDFTYLLGPGRPGDVLVLVPTSSGHEARLYSHKGAEWGSAEAFNDRMNGALWVGPRPTLDELSSSLGIDVRPRDRLGADLRCCGVKALFRKVDQSVDQMVASEPSDDRALAAEVAELRLVKDEFEQQAIREAVGATVAAFNELVQNLRPGLTERDIEVGFDATARRRGNGTGYPTIVAAGQHATVRHWSGTRYSAQAGDLVLVDAGVELESLYTADITRTFPITGRFSAPQRTLYRLVAAAQRAAIEAARPGAPFSVTHTVATRVLAEGLVGMGLVKGSVDSLCDPSSPRYRRYCGQRVSHMLGLDVHDCSAARSGAYSNGFLTPGMVLTVEPGIYLLPGDGTVPTEFRGLGVRIEDDVLITPSGCEVLSSDLPSEVGDVEAWMLSGSL